MFGIIAVLPIPTLLSDTIRFLTHLYETGALPTVIEPLIRAVLGLFGIRV